MHTSTSATQRSLSAGAGRVVAGLAGGAEVEGMAYLSRESGSFGPLILGRPPSAAGHGAVAEWCRDGVRAGLDPGDRPVSRRDVPPSPADHVGSLQRPPELLAAREDHAAGRIDAERMFTLHMEGG